MTLTHKHHPNIDPCIHFVHYPHRKMLIKRLDVTIQSFLWGESAQGKEGEIVAAIQAQRRHLSDQPSTYTVADALNAPVSILHEFSRKVVDVTGKSLVKTVIIGSVPDRGGRANEMRPKARDMGFARPGAGAGRSDRAKEEKKKNGGRNKREGK